MALTGDVKCEADRILGSNDPVNQKMVLLNQLWLRNGLASYQTVPPCKMLVHPSNRGGSMCNGFDVVAKGEKLMSQGFRQDLLESSSVAFALSSDLSKRELQVKANQKLAQQFPGVLADVQGDELYLTVGASHSTSFLKAKKLAGLASGPDSLKGILESGWKWLILASTLEEAFPSLPLLYAAALNSSNSAQVAATELECLATISKRIKLGKPVEQAVADTCIGEPQCKEYIDTIAYFAKLYTGGEEMPMADFLVAFSKQYGESALLGEEFMRMVTHYDFRLQGTVLPCFRVALVATQLSASKVVDKVSKLLVKGDFDRLKNKCSNALKEVELLLHDGWKIVQKAGHLEERKKLGVFGRYCIRLVLFLCQKQKAGRESKPWVNMKEITDQFAAEMLCPPGSSSSSKDAPGKEAPASQVEFHDLLSANEAEIALLQHKHLKVGEHYQNAKYHGATIFKLLDMQQSGAKLLV